MIKEPKPPMRAIIQELPSTTLRRDKKYVRLACGHAVWVSRKTTKKAQCKRCKL